MGAGASWAAGSLWLGAGELAAWAGSVPCFAALRVGSVMKMPVGGLLATGGLDCIPLGAKAGPEVGKGVLVAAGAVLPAGLAVLAGAVCVAGPCTLSVAANVAVLGHPPACAGWGAGAAFMPDGTAMAAWLTVLAKG